MLMIILDATIVNVALPSIQDDLGFSQTNLAWVVNAYLIAFGGLLLLAGRLGDLIGSQAHVPERARRVHRRLAPVRCGSEPGATDRRALRAGRRRRDDVRRDPRNDRDDVPRASRAGEGDRRLQLRRVRGRFDRPAGRWRADRGASTGTGSSSSTCRSASAPHCSRTACSTTTRASGCDKGADVPGAVLVTGSLMLAVYTIVEAAEAGWGSAQTLGLGAVAVALMAAFVLRESRAPHAADPAPHLPLAQRVGSQRGADADGRGPVRDVLPGRVVPAAGARLRPPRGRPGLPAGGGGDRGVLAEGVARTGAPLRGQDHPDPRPGADRRRARAVRARPRSTPRTWWTFCR